MADKIGLETGDGARNINAGKDNEQNISERNPSNVVNNYVDSNNPEPRKRHQTITLEERLDRLEIARNETERTLTRIVSLLDGNPGYRLVGISDQLAAYIKANEDWKLATERRVLTLEKENEEKDEKGVVLTPPIAILGAVILVLFLVIVWLGSHYLQNAGVKGTIPPILPFIFDAIPHVIQGYLWKFSKSY